MRLLFVGTKETPGGAETHLVELARALAELGHDVAAVVRPGSYIEAGLVNSQVRIFHGTFRYSSDPTGTRAVWRAARAFRPDWMFSSFKQEYYSVSAVARLTGAACGFFQHMDHPARALTDFVRPRVCDQLFVPSNFLRDHVVARGAPSRRVTVVYNPVDPRRFHPCSSTRSRMRAKLGFAEDDVVVGYAGRIELAKGSDVLSAALNLAMREDDGIRALWVGSGSWDAGLEASINEQGLEHRHVRTGWVMDTAPYFAAMDLLALPSTLSETFGRVSIEAQASGVPVIGSNLGGIPETMKSDLTGVLIAPGDVASWSASILDMRAREKRSRFSTSAARFASGVFNAQLIARQFIDSLAS